MMRALIVAATLWPQAAAAQFTTITLPVPAGDEVLEAISADEMEYVKMAEEPNTIEVKFYGRQCSDLKAFSAEEIYNYRICPDGRITVVNE
jgi:hypothetical protein